MYNMIYLTRETDRSYVLSKLLKTEDVLINTKSQVLPDKINKNGKTYKVNKYTARPI